VHTLNKKCEQFEAANAPTFLQIWRQPQREKQNKASQVATLNEQGHTVDGKKQKYSPDQALKQGLAQELLQ